MIQHPNSKKVTIFRTGSFINAAQTQAVEFMSMAKQSIGSYWESKTSKGIGSGLSFSEQDLLMPRILDLPKEDRGFRPAIREYFLNICTHVPYEKGRELEIGLEKDNAAPVSEENLPINLTDFIRWRHARKHPWVAASRKEAEGNILVQFYIFDEEETEMENVQLLNTRDEASALYLAMKDEVHKMDQMLTLLGQDPRNFTGLNAMALKRDALRTVVEKESEIFLKAHKQTHFEEKYLLTTMVNTGVLRRVGERYIDAETVEVIGNNLEEAVYFLKDETKSDTINLLKVRMQESLKKTGAPNKKGGTKVPAGLKK